MVLIRVKVYLSSKPEYLRRSSAHRYSKASSKMTIIYQEPQSQLANGTQYVSIAWSMESRTDH